MQKEEIMHFLRQNKQMLQRQYHIERIGLFGSFARDEAHEKSDIDLVIVSPKKSFRNRYNLKYFLEQHFKRDVDIGYLEALHPFVRKQIQNEIVYA